MENFKQVGDLIVEIKEEKPIYYKNQVNRFSIAGVYDQKGNRFLFNYPIRMAGEFVKTYQQGNSGKEICIGSPVFLNEKGEDVSSLYDVNQFVGIYEVIEAAKEVRKNDEEIQRQF